MLQQKRLQALLLGLFVIGIVGAIDSSRVYSAPTTICLRVVTTTQRLDRLHPQKSFTALELDPARGQVRDSASSQWLDHSDFPNSETSPDEHYAAFEYSDSQQHMLVIRDTDSLALQPGNVIYSADDLNMLSILWSADSRLLTYSWQDEAGIHLGISDTQHELRSILLPAPSYQAKLVNFSFEDKYVAAIIANDDVTQNTLNIWSVPDLLPVKTLQLDVANTADPFISAQWSPVGDSLALTAKDKAHPALFIVTPSGPLQKLTTLAHGLETASVDLEWSPHGRYITLQGHPDTATIDGLETLDMVNVQTHVQTNISQQVMETQGAGVAVSLTHWSPDGNRLYFSQYNGNPDMSTNRDLMVYDFTTQQINLVRRYILYGEYLKNPNWMWLAYQNKPNDPDNPGNVSPEWREYLIDARVAVPISMIDNSDEGVNVAESPDGKVVIGWFATPQQWGIRWLKDDGTGFNQLVTGHQIATPTDASVSQGDTSGIDESQWSENSQFVTFEDNHDIGLLDVKSGTVQTIPAQAEHSPSFRAFPSDDGKWVAVFYGASAEFGGSFKTTLKILSSDGKQSYTVATDATDLVATASWSLDSQWLGVQRDNSVDILRPDGNIVFQTPYRAITGQALVWQPCVQ